MPLVDLKDMMHHAYQNGYAVGAFDLARIEDLPPLLAAAESVRAPLVVGVTGQHWPAGDLEWVMAAVEAAAACAGVPVALHAGGGLDIDAVVTAIRLGANGVMVGAPQEPLFHQIDQTRAAVEVAHACGVPVTGTLGHGPLPGGAQGEPDGQPAQYTTPAEARGFVERTGVDFLAVTVGAVGGRGRSRLRVDHGRLKEINAALGLPLAIRGGHGWTDDQYHKLIGHGVARIHHDARAINDAAGGLRTQSRRNRTPVQGLPDRERMVAEFEGRMRAWGAAGRAAEVLARCRPWLNVEHVVVYNAPRLTADALRSLMAEGQRVLSAIPGVRGVRAGSVTDKSTRYRHCWLIRLASPAAIAYFRSHHARTAFVERQFNPAAFDRVAADYCVAGIAPGALALPISTAPNTDGTLAGTDS